MIKIFGKINDSQQVKGHDIVSPGIDWIEMKEDRPSNGDYVATEEGEWKLQTTVIEQINIKLEGE